MNYQIIKDEAQLLEFIDWLPENSKHERFYLTLVARNKYSKEISRLGSNEIALHKFVCDKKEILFRIKQMECPVGSYTHKGLIIPQEALALYINPNPRDLIRANRAVARKCSDLAFEQKYNGFNPLRIAMTEIQKAKNRKLVYDFDFDFDEKEINMQSLIDEITEKVGKWTRKTIIKTRGGFHCMIHLPVLDKEKQQTWHTSMCELLHDTKGDNIMPVVGCTQGGFTPYFLVK